MTGRRRVSSGGPWEERFGYSRAIAVGDTCFVSGTTDAGPDGRSRHPGDAAAQARAVWDIVEAALVDAGFTLADVVRTRTFLVDLADAEAVGSVHAERLGRTRPAATMLAVADLVDPTLRVEIEVDAIRS